MYILYDPVAVGERLRDLRISQRRGTQEEVSNAIDLSAGTYGNLERGSQGMSIDVLMEIAQFYHVSSDYILFGHVTDGCDTNFVVHEISNMIEHCESIKNYLGASE